MNQEERDRDGREAGRGRGRGREGGREGGRAEGEGERMREGGREGGRELDGFVCRRARVSCLCANTKLHILHTGSTALLPRCCTDGNQNCGVKRFSYPAGFSIIGSPLCLLSQPLLSPFFCMAFCSPFVSPLRPLFKSAVPASFRLFPLTPCCLAHPPCPPHLGCLPGSLFPPPSPPPRPLSSISSKDEHTCG